MKKYMTKTRVHFIGAILLIPMLLLQHSVYSQHEKTNKNTPPVLEVYGGQYQKIDRNGMSKSPAYKFTTPGFFMTQVNVDEDGENILGDASNEPSIAIDPTNPDRMAIGWRHFSTITNSFRQAGYGYTTDGGENWTFPDVINPGIFRSDPVLDSDTEGNFYYNSLTVSDDDYYCDVYKSDDGGSTWDNGTFAQGGDKQWMTIDKSGGMGNGHIYAFWSYSYSICDPDFFTRSVDAGVSYEPCATVDGYPYWGTLTVDGNGNLYVAGLMWNDFGVVKSTYAQNPGVGISWDFVTQVDLDGSLVGFGGNNCPNPSGLLGQTNIDADRSGGEYDGNVYILASVERYSVNDPCDVMFSKSTNGGLTFSNPIRINDDPGTNSYQWFGTMSVAPNGRIDVVWLDTRDNPGDVNSALYYTYSMDAGDTWLENVKLSESFDPHVGWPQQEKMGDYFHMISDETGAHLAWAGTFNGEQDVYYGHITTGTTGLPQAQKQADFELFQNYPNPFAGKTNIRFHLAESGFVSLKVLDVSGREVESLVNDHMSSGYHNVVYNAENLKEGTYYYQLSTDYSAVTKKLVLIK